MEQIQILIPSLNPDEKLITVLNSLKKQGFSRFLIIDDGSEEKELFRKAQQEFGCHVITHSENKGKGCALKTGFRHILEEKDAEIKAVVTVDGDNQHKAEDVFAVSEAITENSLVLGVREFKSKENVPFRSRIGNLVSAKVFQILSGEKISDTQTGLRGIPVAHLEKFLDISGERFEYEMNVLLQVRKLGLNLLEIPISTIYLEENESSHFRPVLDSLRVFYTIFAFTLVSFFCFLVDYFLFLLLLYGIMNGEESSLSVFVSSLIARVFSSFLNFSLNYRLVFQSSVEKTRSIFKYYALAVVQMLCSSSVITFLSVLDFAPLLAKPLVDLTLFFFSYYVQKIFIFNQRRG